MTMKEKLTSAIAGSIAMFALATTATFADTTLEISGNGDGSTNTITVTSEQNCTVKQSSDTDVHALVGASASTGGNEASGNTGGNVTINTGNATANASVTVTGGSNTATDPCCCQQCNECEGCSSGENAAVISGNGHGSTNDITVDKKKNTRVRQRANTSVGALVGAKAKTGKNKTNSNTNGTVLIDTGTTNSTASVDVFGGTNTINP